jgi:hypothetical protein
MMAIPELASAAEVRAGLAPNRTGSVNRRNLSRRANENVRISRSPDMERLLQLGGKRDLFMAGESEPDWQDESPLPEQTRPPPKTKALHGVPEALP